MKLVSALVGLAALGAVALSTATASAMPVTIPGQSSQASNVEQIAYVCNGWGHCWHQSAYGDGYYHPHYRGGWGWHRGWGYGWHHWHRWHSGWGYGWRHWHRWHGGWSHWHQWHPGWGYGWHRWHHWHQW
jgi:hypothetical protein